MPIYIGREHCDPHAERLVIEFGVGDVVTILGGGLSDDGQFVGVVGWCQIDPGPIGREIPESPDFDHDTDRLAPLRLLFPSVESLDVVIGQLQSLRKHLPTQP